MLHDPDAKDFARRVWGSLPISERTIRNISAECAKLGRTVSISSVQRWIKEFEHGPPPPTQRIEIIDAGEPIAPEGLNEGMKQALDAVIDPRLGPILRNDHIRRLEDYLVDVAEEIHSRRKEVAKLVCDPEAESETVETDKDGNEKVTKLRRGQVGRDAVVAIVQIANGIRALMETRAVYAGNYRHIGEYEMFSGKGRKDRAEANVLDEGNRANRAKEIHGSAGKPNNDANDALAILRGMALKQ